MKIIPHNKPTLGEEEGKSALRVLDSAWVARGEEVESFEKEFFNFICLPDGHAVALNSGATIG